MTQTTDETPPPPQGPRVTREEMHDINRLRRSSTDRYVAGVAGGLGRHFDIDPTIVRVLLVVLCFFGGAGVLLYGAGWLLLPDDHHEQAPVHVAPETRKALLIGVTAVAALLLVGDAWGNFGIGDGWPLGIIAVIVALVLVARDRRRTQAAVPPAGAAPTPPIHAYDYVYEPRPRRTGLVLFWPTLALIALGLGVLGIYDIDHHVAAGAWAALALAIIGVMLVVGAFAGRPGGLILLGLIAVPALAITSVLGNSFHDNGVRIDETPQSVAQVHQRYAANTGQIRLDLSEVSDPAALDGKAVNIDLRAGEIVVTLPPGVTTRVHSDIRYGGDIDVDGVNRNGWDTSYSTTVTGSAGAAAPTMDLYLSTKFGHIEVNQG